MKENPGGMPFSGITKSEEDPSHPPRAVEGEDVPKAARDLAHGQGLDLRKRESLRTSVLHLARRWKERWTNLVKALELRHRLDEGGVICQMFPQDVPELRLTGCSGHGLYLGVPARRGLQARNLLTQHGARSPISSGSGPSSSGRLRRAVEGGLGRRHVRNCHLIVARHLLAFGKERAGCEAAQEEEEDVGSWS